MSGCGAGTRPNSTGTAGRAAPWPALGITEDNAQLLLDPRAPAALAAQVPAGAAVTSTARVARARELLGDLHPRYVRLLVDWAALQPDPERPADLRAANGGCARTVAPCVPFAGVQAQLAALVSRQRAAGAEADFRPVIEIFGAPRWAARGPSGCERPGTRAFSRPLTAAGLTAYRSLIRGLLALGAREGVALEWWSPWNEPNDPVFVSPQRASCDPAAPPASPAVYAELARAMAGELRAAGGNYRLLLGELNAFQSDSPHRTSMARFVAALPDDVVCLSDTWAVHAYAARGRFRASLDPVRALEAALDARGACARSAQIWVTEAGAGAPHPGSPRPAGGADERAGCIALAAQLYAWQRDPRVGAVFQYTLREDPAYPVGLLAPGLQRPYPAYALWRAWTGRRAGSSDGASLAQACG